MVYSFLAMSMALPTTQAADEPRTTASTVNVIFIGDSITEGIGVHDRPTQAAPVACINELRKLLSDASVYFSNQGHNGATTTDYLPGSQYLDDVVAAGKQLTADHPGQLVFSIMLGTNDSANRGPNGAPVSDSSYRDNLKKIIDRILADLPQSKFILNDPIWYSPNTHNGADYEGNAAANRLKSYFTQLDALVGEYQAILPGNVFRGDTQAYDHFSIYFQSELNGENGQRGIFFLHPNIAGAQALGKFWAAAIARSLISLKNGKD